MFTFVEKTKVMSFWFAHHNEKKELNRFSNELKLAYKKTSQYLNSKLL